jgi:hypothetical protein
MRLLMGIVKDRHGTYCARKKVPQHLEAAVARVLNGRKSRQSWLKRSLRTKDLATANVRAKPVLIEFDRILERARKLYSEKPAPHLPRTLSQSEIDSIADAMYARMLAQDEESRSGGRPLPEPTRADTAGRP